MMNSRAHKHGFTLIEVLLVVAIMAVIAAIGVPIYSNALAKNDLNLAVTELKQTLFRAQTQARAGVQDAVWGVHIDTTGFILYQGDSWGVRDSSFDEIHMFPRSYDIAGDTDIQFERLLGRALSSYSVTLSIPGTDILSTISVSISGAIGVESSGGGSTGGGGDSGGSGTPPDTTAPAQITDLVASNETTDSVTLTWTSPGDDGTTGTASSYDIRFDTSVIDDTTWTVASQLPSAPAPQIAGSNESVVVSGLLSDVNYWFAIKARDEVPNESTLSNIPNALTLSTGCSQLGYIDQDDDGYGVGSEVCVDGFATWASQGGDCYDQNANARPGQTGWFSTHRGDGSYDYDCNSSQSRRWSGWVNSSNGHCFSQSSQCNNARNKWFVINSSQIPACGVAKQFGTSCSTQTYEDCQFVGSQYICFDETVYCLSVTNRSQQCH